MWVLHVMIKEFRIAFKKPVDDQRKVLSSLKDLVFYNLVLPHLDSLIRHNFSYECLLILLSMHKIAYMKIHSGTT